MRLFRQSKFLFVMVVLVFALHINANFFLGGQQSPFFRWNLYAAPIPSQQDYSLHEIIYNGGKIYKIPPTWQRPTSYMLSNQLEHYLYMREHGKGQLDEYISNWNRNHPEFGSFMPGLQLYPDSTQMKGFADWFHRKLEQITGETITDITILKVTLQYKPDGSVQLLSSVPICKLK